MSNILVIKSSLNGNQGQSNILAQTLVSKLATETTANIIERDLAQEALPHLTQSEMAAWMTEEKERTQEQADLAAISDNLIDELKLSDTLVIAMPMYNFGIPSTFKAWIDRVARAGVTFRYTETGPVGLMENKKAIVLAARGGIYKDTAHDSQTQYLKDVLAFIGITDVTFIYAEGLNMPGREQRLAAAVKEIDGVAL
ncbi:NAD(P)H-dependent oxidoreductase [Vibrio sp. TH_r3]|uniref:FMN-dependent NADH-azoreductase n=1 Tax=Vibrio sp. TH_r3 TaxID=3082084 RepID=UPI002954AC8E|nr:NAD(P)H-dependent oxidoreductase [Vibrio sp. TH_r3]MDV7104648.1 NAD(P)H-dependent oxidoreductase [Vibrio sp. TH_r3]